MKSKKPIVRWSSAIDGMPTDFTKIKKTPRQENKLDPLSNYLKGDSVFTRTEGKGLKIKGKQYPLIST